MMIIYTTASLKRDQLKKFICFHQISYFEHLFLQKVWNKFPTCNLFTIDDFIINNWRDYSLEMDFKNLIFPSDIKPASWKTQDSSTVNVWN